MFRSRPRIELKSRAEIRLMRRAGLVVADALSAVRAAARPGVTTGDLDRVAADVIAAAGATPSFLGYHGFPATICTSVNDEIVHGIPGTRSLAVGDVVSVDCGAIVDGWHGDSAVSFQIGPDGALGPDDPRARELDADDAALVLATRSAMWAGVAALASARRVGEVGDAVEMAAETAGGLVGTSYGIVEEYTGHGIGTAMHQPPDVLNFRATDRGPRVRAGMCLAVEPMLTRGTEVTRVLGDDWTVVAADGARAAHWEHTVAVLDDGIAVLTAADLGREGLAAFDVVPVDLD
ncbi:MULTISPECIES: type I methionyl aminopeptidase [Isoptericola]|uniref:Methionine aminopeptidase n=1 Tax=Isoptericola haloaureus TaxID=1542902 RepID=A0ABU7Z8Q7_9MICO|nr:type I methionyl aminopeptidase [Isoptericola sp. AK164]